MTITGAVVATAVLIAIFAGICADQAASRRRYLYEREWFAACAWTLAIAAAVLLAGAAWWEALA